MFIVAVRSLIHDWLNYWHSAQGQDFHRRYLLLTPAQQADVTERLDRMRGEMSEIIRVFQTVK